MKYVVLQWMFLYFPEDKSEYIPAIITSAIFLAGAVLTMWFFIKHSKKEEENTSTIEIEKDKNET